MSHVGRCSRLVPLSRLTPLASLGCRSFPLFRFDGSSRGFSEKKTPADERHHRGASESHKNHEGKTPKKGEKGEAKSHRKEGKDKDEKGAKEEHSSKPQGWFSRILTGPTADPNAPHQSHSSLLSASSYIYELVTHDAKPGERENYLKVYESYVGELRKSIPCMQLIGSWRVFYGNRDQAVHLWRYDNGYADVDRHPDNSKLLEGKTVYICNSAMPGAPTFVQIWCPLISHMGGTVAQEMPKEGLDVLLADPLCSNDVIELARKQNAIIVSSEWIIQSIIQGSLPPPDGHERFRYDYADRP